MNKKKLAAGAFFFRSLTFIYLFVTLALFYPVFFSSGDDPAGSSSKHTAFVKLTGAIAADKNASASKINSSLKKAFENKNAVALILVINSPGGSPVQSRYVYDEILRLRIIYPEKKLYAVIEDIGASGAYYIAAAADEIYANRSSLVGSIGVTASSFGFVELLDKLGIERRHFTAGEHKAFLDPFTPLKEDEKVFWKKVLDNTHQQFITAVERGRGDKLDITNDITSGLIWNGEQALELGLIDGLGSARFVAREIVGEERLINYSFEESFFTKLSKKLGSSIGNGFAGYFTSEIQSPQL